MLALLKQDWKWIFSADRASILGFAALEVDNLFVKMVKFLKKIEKVVNQEEQQLIDF